MSDGRAEEKIMEILSQVCENLKARGFSAQVFNTKAEAVDYLNRQVDHTTVGFGGSMTLKQLGLYDSLSTHNEVHWHWVDGSEARNKAMNDKIYITSANGLAETGEIINIDGAGNRVASTLFGHDKVYFVIGRNKVESTYEQALWRARNIAGPKNAQRMGRKTPCAAKGDRCYDCDSPERICRALVVLWEPMMGMDTEVILVNEELGM